MKITRSLCPECQKPIRAEFSVVGDNVTLSKTCPKHGRFEEKCSDRRTFERASKYWKNVQEKRNSKAATDFRHGYAKHLTETCLAIIDLTSRCNLRCSYCFANSAGKTVYEPTLKQIKDQISFLREAQPRSNAILFSGGEPTLRPDILEILDHARAKRFECLMIATNGIRLSNDLDLMRDLVKHGVWVLYLSFDGLTDETNKEKRNHRIIEKLVENCRKTGMGLILVPTIIKGTNDHEVNDILEFAIKNVDVVRGVNFQPVGFSGRMPGKERAKHRYTISDLCKDIERQSGGKIGVNEFYPVTAAIPFMNFLEALGGERTIKFSMHPMCGSATYVYVDKGKVIPLSEFLDVDGFLDLCKKYTKKLGGKNSINRTIAIASFLNESRKFIGNKRVELIGLLVNLIWKRDYAALEEFHKKALFVGAMHFQDMYNLDLERLKRCGVHYVTPDKRLIPFCAYNNLGYRDEVERKFSTHAQEESSFSKNGAASKITHPS